MFLKHMKHSKEKKKTTHTQKMFRNENKKTE